VFSSVDFGPGDRIYFGKDGDTVVVLLGGGTKQRQDETITRPNEPGSITSCARSASDGARQEIAWR